MAVISKLTLNWVHYLTCGDRKGGEQNELEENIEHEKAKNKRASL